MNVGFLREPDGKKKVAYAFVSFGWQLFNTSQPKTSMFCKELRAVYFALMYISHFIWYEEKLAQVMKTESLTGFFPIKLTPYLLVELYVQDFASNVALPLIPGRGNAAADFLFCMQTDHKSSLELHFLD